MTHSIILIIVHILVAAGAIIALRELWRTNKKVQKIKTEKRRDDIVLTQHRD